MNGNPVNPKLTLEQETEIEADAEWLAEDRFPNGKYIDPFEIARSVDIDVIWGHYDDQFDGILEHENGRFFIFCNLDRVETPASPRARFTLAHELGHFYIAEHRNALKCGFAPKHPSHCDHESKNPVEIEADYFASCLLMPSQRFRNRAKKVQPGLKAICQLANDFGTSLTSTAIRYAKLDLMHCAIIKWDNKGYGWKWLSPSAFASGWRKTIETPAQLLRDSATEQVLSGTSPKLEVVLKGSTATHWFPFIPDGSQQNCILHEEAISLGRFGALTLLSPAEQSNL